MADYDVEDQQRKGNTPARQKPLLNLWALIGINPLHPSPDQLAMTMVDLQAQGDKARKKNALMARQMEAMRRRHAAEIEETMQYHEDGGKKKGQGPKSGLWGNAQPKKKYHHDKVRQKPPSPSFPSPHPPTHSPPRAKAMALKEALHRCRLVMSDPVSLRLCTCPHHPSHITPPPSLLTTLTTVDRTPVHSCALTITCWRAHGSLSTKRTGWTSTRGA